MGFQYDRSNDPKAAITWGRDFNFYQVVTPGSATLGTFVASCDATISFPTYTVIFWAPAGAVIEYSFNGNTIHGKIDGSGSTAPAFLTFENRVISKIWLSGTGGALRIEAWGIR